LSFAKPAAPIFAPQRNLSVSTGFNCAGLSE
jgi:hypothetical protein